VRAILPALILATASTALACAHPIKGLDSWGPIPVPASDTSMAARLAGLRRLNPDSLARAAAAHHDYHLLGVQSFALSVPGLGGDWTAYAARYGVRAIDGTSEMDVSGEYQTAADAFALSYNLTILKLLPEPWR